MEKNGLKIDIVLEKVFNELVTILGGELLKSESPFGRIVDSGCDCYGHYDIYSDCKQIMEIREEDNYFWLVFGRVAEDEHRTNERASIFFVSVKNILKNSNKTDFADLNIHGDQLLDLVMSKSHFYERYFGMNVIFETYSGGNFKKNKKIKMLPAKELLNGFVVQKSEYNPEYLIHGGSCYVNEINYKEVLWSESFVAYLTEKIIDYVANYWEVRKTEIIESW